MSFHLFLFGFAIDAQFSDRTGSESLDADILSAVHAFAVVAVFDLLERNIDLREQTLFPFAKPPGELKIDLGRRRIDLVGEIIRVEMYISARDRPLLISLQLGSLFQKQLLEFLTISLIQSIPLRRPVCADAPAWFRFHRLSWWFPKDRRRSLACAKQFELALGLCGTGRLGIFFDYPLERLASCLSKAWPQPQQTFPLTVKRF